MITESREVYRVRRFDYNTGELFTFWNLTDLHVGMLGTRHDLIEKAVKAIEDDPRALWIGGGDYGDFINHRDKRFEPNLVSDWVLHNLDNVAKIQVDYVYDSYFKRIADKCLMMMEGNHEWDTTRYNPNYNPYNDLRLRVGQAAGMTDEANDLAVGAGGFLTIMFSRRHKGKRRKNMQTWQFNTYHHHGHGNAGVAQGGYSLKLERMLDRRPTASLITMGHLHVHSVERIAYLEQIKTGKVVQHSRMAMFLPSYLDQPISDNDLAVTSTYSKKRGMMPTDFGARPVIIDPNRRTYTTEV